MSLKFKYIALDKTINIILRNMEKSPERCARNLTELGSNICKKNFETNQKIQRDFIELCKKNDRIEIKKIFFNTYLQ